MCKIICVVYEISTRPVAMAIRNLVEQPKIAFTCPAEQPTISNFGLKLRKRQVNLP